MIKYLVPLIVIFTCVINADPVLASDKKHVSSSQGIEFVILNNWKIKEYSKYIRVSHVSGKANCTFGIEQIPGVELLTQAELDEQVTKSKNISFAELLSEKYRYVKTSKDLEYTKIGGRKATEIYFEIDPADKSTKEIELCLQSPCKQNIYNITKKIRLISTTTNRGAHSFVCTADYGDFDITNKAFEKISRAKESNLVPPKIEHIYIKFLFSI